MNRCAPRAALALILLALLAPVAAAYVLVGFVWPDGTITMQLHLGSPSRPLSDGSTSYGAIAESALGDWNRAISRAQFNVVRDSTAPQGDGDGINSVSFATDVYGMALDPGTLAVTTSWRRGNTHTESDVVFNSAVDWDSYSGPRRAAADFRRVALHEFGHVLGLTHTDENGQSVASIMSSHSLSNTDRLTDDDVSGAQAMYGASGAIAAGGNVTVSFPPRDELLAFRTRLEARYRDDLHGAAAATAVDLEGDVVWVQEYLRYRVYQCSHQEATARVMTEVDGNPAPAVCGSPAFGAVQFPPRNDALDFRNQLEAKYRDDLRRGPTSTFVDRERDVVWIQEYLRYRVNSCGPGAAVQSVMTQTDGRSAPPVCR
jgi:hypothetical protein